MSELQVRAKGLKKITVDDASRFKQWTGMLYRDRPRPGSCTQSPNHVSRSLAKQIAREASQRHLDLSTVAQQYNLSFKIAESPHKRKSDSKPGKRVFPA